MLCEIKLEHVIEIHKIDKYGCGILTSTEDAINYVRGKFWENSRCVCIVSLYLGNALCWTLSSGLYTSP